MRVNIHKFTAIVTLCMCLSHQHVQAQEPDKTYKIYYQLYSGGIKALSADLTIQKTHDSYSINMEAYTKGFLKRLVPWSGRFWTRGEVRDDNNYIVREHNNATIWRKETKLKTYSYDQDGKFLSYLVQEDGVDKTPASIDPRLTKNTRDILTAAMEVMTKIANDEGCRGTTDIFDGKRRYGLTFLPEGQETLKRSRYNAYEGPSESCVAEVSPKGGKWSQKPRGWLSIQEQGRNKGQLPTIWFGKPEPDAEIVVPVKVRVKSDYGTLMMHLKDVEVGD